MKKRGINYLNFKKFFAFKYQKFLKTFATFLFVGLAFSFVTKRVKNDKFVFQKTFGTVPCVTGIL